LKLFELKRDRDAKSVEARTIVQGAITAGRALNAEETTKIDGFKEEIRNLDAKINTFELRDTFESADPEERSAMEAGPELPNLDGKIPYSLNRALAQSLDRNSRTFTGIEGEVHQELRKHRVDAPQGILIPMTLRNQQLAKQAREKRDLTTSTGAGGIANILGSELIEILRNKMVLNLLGARVLNGVTGGTFSLPKQNATTTAGWTPEQVAVAKSNLSLNQVTWTPRTLTAITVMSRKAILQTSLDFEAMSREDLMRVLAIEYDRVGVNGSGQNNQPLGIGQDPNVPITPIGTNGGSITWALVVALETAVAVANADFGKLAYLTSNNGRGIMKNTFKGAASTFPLFLWEKGVGYGEGEVNGYRAVSSQQIPANLTKGSGTALTQLLFGNFDSATYALWSGMDTLVDPYSQGAAGSVLIYMYQDCDFQLRWEQAFAKIVDMATS
jgi:HK97 family phage major capsid protein